MSTALPITGVECRERVLVFGTVLALLAGAFVLGLGYAREATLEALGAASVAMMGVGKFLPFWGVMGHSNFSPWELGLLVWALDTLVAIVIIYGSDGLCRIRLIRRVLDRVRSRAQRTLAARPNVKRGAVAVILFVLLPFTGTGAVVGTFLGMLLGLRRRVVIAAVSAGGLLGGMLMAFLAEFGGALSPGAPTGSAALKFIMIALLVALAALALWWLVRLHRRSRLLTRENERLSRLAHCDELTGLGNRRAFDAHLDQALARAERCGETVSVLLADVDGMKRLNDTFGHPAGDRALERVGAVLAACVRGTDFAARLGGDEFAAILPSTTSREAEHLAERIRSGIATLELLGTHRLTASIGVATFAQSSERSDSAADLFARADSALYVAKQGGRNLVRVGGNCVAFAS